jgi:hypothetical protein
MSTPYFDLASLTEDQRITAIGEVARKTGGKIGFIVENRPRTIARYMAKLLREFPEVIVVKVGLVKGGGKKGEGYALTAQVNTQGKN